MNRMMRERMEVAGLAHRRYPDMELPLAIACFLSDRMVAGLGALDERRRKGHGEIRNRKRMDWTDAERVLYDLTIDRPERQRWPKTPLLRLEDVNEHSTITLEIVPAAIARLCLPVGRRMLADQFDRKALAQELRRVRRDMRAGKP